jgi:hypothetical protein
MPSRALQEWRTTQRAELDRLEAAVRRARASSAADRALRQQLVDAYIVLLAGHFQRFCRELHGQAAECLVGNVGPPAAQTLVRDLIVTGRALSRSNATAAALGGDFGRVGMKLWSTLLERQARNSLRRRRLEQLNAWRNAIAHQDHKPDHGRLAAVAGTDRSLRWATVWRANCSALARELDVAVSQHLTNLVGSRPW